MQENKLERKSVLSAKTFTSHLTSEYEQRMVKDDDSKSSIKIVKDFMINMEIKLGWGTSGKVYAAFDTDQLINKVTNRSSHVDKLECWKML